MKRWNFSQGRSVRHWRMEPTEEHNSSQVSHSHSSTDCVWYLLSVDCLLVKQAGVLELMITSMSIPSYHR